MKPPSSLSEYIALVHQAVDEAADFLQSIEDSDMEEDMERWTPVAAHIDDGLRRLLDELERGTHRFGPPDLPFMALVERWRRGIPFAGLLDQINQTHLKGF